MLGLFFFALALSDIYVKDDCSDFNKPDDTCITPSQAPTTDISQDFGSYNILLYTDLDSQNTFDLGKGPYYGFVSVSGKKEIIDPEGNIKDIDFMRVYYIDLVKAGEVIDTFTPRYLELRFTGPGELGFVIANSQRTIFVAADECDKITGLAYDKLVSTELESCVDHDTTSKNRVAISLAILDDCTPYKYAYYSKCLKPTEIKKDTFVSGYASSTFKIYIGTDILTDHPLCFKQTVDNIQIINYNIEKASNTRRLMETTYQKYNVIINVDESNGVINELLSISDLNLKFIQTATSVLPASKVQLTNVGLQPDECAKKVFNDAAIDYMKEHSSSNTLKCFGIPEKLNFVYSTIVISDKCDEIYFNATISRCYSPQEYVNTNLNDLNDGSETITFDIRADFTTEISFAEATFTKLTTLVIKHKKVEGYIKNLPIIKLNIDSLKTKRLAPAVDFEYVDVTLMTAEISNITWPLGKNVNLLYSKLSTSTGINYTAPEGFKLTGKYSSNYALFGLSPPNEYTTLYITSKESSALTENLDIKCILPTDVGSFDFQSFRGELVDIVVSETVPLEQILKIPSLFACEFKITGEKLADGTNPTLSIIFDDYVYFPSKGATIEVTSVNLVLRTEFPQRKISLSFDNLTFNDVTISGQIGKIFILKEGASLVTTSASVLDYFAKINSIKISVDCSSHNNKDVKCLEPTDVSTFESLRFDDDAPNILITLTTNLTDTQTFDLALFPENQSLMITSDSTTAYSFTFSIPNIQFDRLMFNAIDLSFKTSVSTEIKAKQMEFISVNLNPDLCTTVALDGLFYSNDSKYSACWPSEFSSVIVSNNCIVEDPESICIKSANVDTFNFSELKADSVTNTITIEIVTSSGKAFDFTNWPSIETSLHVFSKVKTNKFIFKLQNNTKFKDITFESVNLVIDYSITAALKCNVLTISQVTFERDLCSLVYIDFNSIVADSIPDGCFTYNPNGPIYDGLLIAGTCTNEVDDKNIRCLSPTDVSTFKMSTINRTITKFVIDLQTDLTTEQVLDFSMLAFSDKRTLVIESATESHAFTFKILKNALKKIYIKNINLDFDTTSSTKIDAKLMKFNNVVINENCTDITYSGQFYTDGDNTYNCWTYEYNSLVVLDNCIDQETITTDLCIEKTEITAFKLTKLTPKNDKITIKLGIDLAEAYLFDIDSAPDCSLAFQSNDSTAKALYFRIPDKTLKDLYFTKINLNFVKSATNSQDLFCDHVYFSNSHQVEAQCSAFNVISPYANSVVCQAGECNANCFVNTLFDTIVVSSTSEKENNTIYITSTEISTYDLRKIDPSKVLTIDISSTTLEAGQTFDFSKIWSKQSVLVKGSDAKEAFTFKIPASKEFTKLYFQSVTLSLDSTTSTEIKAEFMKFISVTTEATICSTVTLVGKFYTVDESLKTCWSSSFESLLVSNDCINEDPASLCISNDEVSLFKFGSLLEDPIQISLKTDLLATELFDFDTIATKSSLSISSVEGKKKFTFKLPLTATFHNITLNGLDLSFDTTKNSKMECNELILTNIEMNNQLCYSFYIKYNDISLPQGFPVDCFSYNSDDMTYSSFIVTETCPTDLAVYIKCLKPTEVSSFDLSKINLNIDVLDVTLEADLTELQIFDLTKLRTSMDITIKSNDINQTKNFFFSIPADLEIKDIKLYGINFAFTGETKNLHCQHLMFYSSEQNEAQCTTYNIISPIVEAIVCDEASTCFNDCLYNLRYRKIEIKETCGADVPSVKCLTPSEVSTFDLRNTRPGETITIELSVGLTAEQKFDFTNAYKTSPIIIKSDSETTRTFTFQLAANLELNNLTFTCITLAFDTTSSNTLKCKVLTFNNVEMDNKLCYSVVIDATEYSTGLSADCFTYNTPDLYSSVIVKETCSPQVSELRVICLLPADVSAFDLSKINSHLTNIEITLDINLAEANSFTLETVQSDLTFKSSGPTRKNMFLKVPSIELKDIYLTNIELSMTGENKNMKCNEIHLTNSIIEQSSCSDYFVISNVKDFLVCDSDSTCPAKCLKDTFSEIEVHESCEGSNESSVCLTPSEVADFNFIRAQDVVPIYITLFTSLTSEQSFNFSTIPARKKILITSADDTKRTFTFVVPGAKRFSQLFFKNLELTIDYTASKRILVNYLKFISTTLMNEQKTCNDVTIGGVFYSTNGDYLDCFNKDTPMFINIYEDCFDNILNDLCLEPNEVTSFNIKDYFDVLDQTTSFTINLNCNLTDSQIFSFEYDYYRTYIINGQNTTFTFVPPESGVGSLSFKDIKLSFDITRNALLQTDSIVFYNVEMDLKYCYQMTIILDYFEGSSLGTQYPSDCFMNYKDLVISNNCPESNEDYTICITPDKVAEFDTRKLINSVPTTITLETSLSNTQLLKTEDIARNQKMLIKSAPLHNSQPNYTFTFKVPAEKANKRYLSIVCHDIILSFDTTSNNNNLDVGYLKLIDTTMDQKFCTSLSITGSFYSNLADYNTCAWNKKASYLSIYRDCFEDPLGSLCIEPDEVEYFSTSKLTGEVTITLNTNLDSTQVLNFDNSASVYTISPPTGSKNKFAFTLKLLKLHYSGFIFSRIKLTFDTSITNIFTCDSLTVYGVKVDNETCSSVMLKGTLYDDDNVLPADCFAITLFSTIHVGASCVNSPDNEYYCIKPAEVSSFDFQIVLSGEPVTFNLLEDLTEAQSFDFSRFNSDQTDIVIQSLSKTTKFKYTHKIDKTVFHSIVINDITLSFNTTTSSRINCQNFTLKNVNLDSKYCGKISVNGRFYTSGGNVESSCILDTFNTKKPIVISSNNCTSIDLTSLGFGSFECETADSINGMKFDKKTDGLVIVLDQNLDKNQIFNFATLPEKSNIDFIGLNQYSLTFDVTDKKYGNLTFTKINLDLKTYGNDLIDCIGIKFTDVEMSKDYCSKVFVPKGFLYEGDEKYKDCFKEANDVISEYNTALIIYVNVDDNAKCSKVIEKTKIECIASAGVPTYNFSVIEPTIKTISIYLFGTISGEFFDLRTIQKSVDLSILSGSDSYIPSCTIDLARIGDKINVFEINRVSMLKFDTNTEKKLIVNKFVLNNILALSVIPSDSKVDISNVKEIDFSDDSYKASFDNMKLETVNIKTDNNEIVISGGKVNGQEIDDTVKQVVVKTDQTNININADKSLTAEIIIEPSQAQSSVTVTNADTKFGVKLNNKDVTINSESGDISLSASGSGQIKITLPPNQKTINIKNEIQSENIQVSVPSFVNTVNIGKVLLAGGNPSFNVITTSSNSKQLKDDVVVNVDSVVVDDFVDASVVSSIVVKSLKIGLLSTLKGKIGFNANTEVNIDYYKGPAVPLSIDGVTGSPKSVKLVKSSAISDTDNWPFSIKLFSATDENKIEFSDTENQYDKKVVDGFLIASLKRTPSEGGVVVDPTPAKNDFPVGGIVGIVVGVIVVIVVVLGVIKCVREKPKRDDSNSDSIDLDSHEEERNDPQVVAKEARKQSSSESSDNVVTSSSSIKKNKSRSSSNNSESDDDSDSSDYEKGNQNEEV